MENDNIFNSGLQEKFASRCENAIKTIAKEFGLEKVEVQYDDPMIIAVRGCLQANKQDPGEPIELVVMLSPDLSTMNKLTQSTGINPKQKVPSPEDIKRSFDLTNSVVNQTIAEAGRSNPKEQKPGAQGPI